MSSSLEQVIRNDYFRKRHDIIMSIVATFLGGKYNYWQDRLRWKTESNGDNVAIFVDGQYVGVLHTDYPEHPTTLDDINIEFLIRG
ncbi:MAG: hypothetical protein V4450_07525 [Bacteroidota bacterium]